MPKMQAALIYTKRQKRHTFVIVRSRKGETGGNALSAAFAAAALLTCELVIAINYEQFPARRRKYRSVSFSRVTSGLSLVRGRLRLKITVMHYSSRPCHGRQRRHFVPRFGGLYIANLHLFYAEQGRKLQLFEK